VIENVVPLNQVLFVEWTRNGDRNTQRTVPKMPRAYAVSNTKKLLDAADTHKSALFVPSLSPPIYLFPSSALFLRDLFVFTRNRRSSLYTQS